MADDELICKWCLDRLGRRVAVAAGDRFCRACGHALRRVEFRVRRGGEWVAVADGVAAPFVVHPDGGRIEVQLLNAGTAAVRIARLHAAGHGVLTIAEGPKDDVEVVPGSPINVVLTTPPGLTGVVNATLEADGDFGTIVLSVRLAAAPKTLLIERVDEAHTPRVDSSRVQPSIVAKLLDGNGPCQWKVPDGQALTLPCWPGEGRARFRLRAGDGAADPFNVGQAALTDAHWSIIVTPASASTTARVRDRKAWGCEIEVQSGSPEETVRGVVTVGLLGGLLAPLNVPVQMSPHTPAWRLSPESDGELEAMRLPGGYWSGLRLLFTPVQDSAAAAGDVRYELLVTAGDDSEVGRPVAEAGGQGNGRAFRVRICPAAGARRITLIAQMRRRLPNGDYEPCSARIERFLGTNDDPPVARVVVDFGTTNTCVARADLADRDRCMPLAVLAGVTASSDDADQIPTLLWVGDHADMNWPECLIGVPAERAAAGGGTLARAFKPRIGTGESETLHAAPGTPPQTISCERLSLLFFRELILEIRRTALGQRPVRELHVTFPTAFSQNQRQALREQVLGQLRNCGLAGHADATLDEANAGAFRELAERLRAAPMGSRPDDVWAMTMDFGGGTIDVSVLHARRDRAESENAGLDIYDIYPMGVTGVPDFAGVKITYALADLLEKRLDRLMNSNKFGRQDKNGVLVLPSFPRPTDPPDMVRQGKINGAWVRELADRLKRGNYAETPQGLDERLWAPRAFNEQAQFLNRLMLIKRDNDKRTTEVVPGALLSKWLAAPAGVAVTPPATTEPGADSEASKVDPPKPGDGTTADYALGTQHNVTRRELDEHIAPALREAFGRAERMWQMIRNGQERLGRPVSGLDYLFLAGNTARLPIIREMARERLGLEDLKIMFDPTLAKRVVALGAADFVRHATEPPQVNNVKLRPAPTTDYLLVPVAIGIGDGYQYVMMPGVRMNSDPVDLAFANVGPMSFELFQPLDYRTSLFDGSKNRIEHRKTGDALKASLKMDLDLSVQVGDVVVAPPHEGLPKVTARFRLKGDADARSRQLQIDWPHDPTGRPVEIELL